MSNPEPPVEIPRPVFSRRAESSPLVADSGEDTPFQPRYVQLHALRDHGYGPRNLAWGVVMLVFALAVLGLALFLAGPRAFLAIGTCLVTCTALFVLARLHVLRQRNGGFFALGVVCLLAAAVPLIEQAYLALEHVVKNRPSQPAAPIAGQVSANTPLSLSSAFALSAPDAKAGPRVRVLKDSQVTIDGKPFLIKAGELFRLGSQSDGEVTLVVRDLLVALPAEAAEVLDPVPTTVATNAAPAASLNAPSPGPAQPTDAVEAPLTGAETPAQLTARAQREAIRRYPALGVKDSLENQMFVSTFREIRDAGGDDFFTNPEWPIELAELLAKREKWVRGAAPITVSSGPGAAVTEDAELEEAAVEMRKKAADPAGTAEQTETAPEPQVIPEE